MLCCVSGSGARVTLAVCIWLPGWAQALSACRALISACCFRSSASCFALSLSLLSCGVWGFFLIRPRSFCRSLFFGGGGRGSPLICCDSCHCEGPHRVSALVSSAAQTEEMVLKQMMMALRHGARLQRRPRLNNTRAAPLASVPLSWSPHQSHWLFTQHQSRCHFHGAAETQRSSAAPASQNARTTKTTMLSKTGQTSNRPGLS